jgi:hypothetical protein
MRLPGERERKALIYGLHHPEKACVLGMTIIAVALVLHVFGIIPEVKLVSWNKVPSVITPAFASERGK